MFDGCSAATVLAVVSGKGGVGKSIIATNLALTWANTGARVALVDADVGQSSCAFLLGQGSEVRLVTAPDHLVQDPAKALAALDSQLATLKTTCDFVVVDAPAGIGHGVRWALDRADASLLVLVDEPTAAADAYSLCKMIWTLDPEYPLAGVVNMTDTEEEAAHVISRFSALTHHFLDRKILYGGWVPFSGEIRRSVRKQIPAVNTSSVVADAFQGLSARVRCGVFETRIPVAMN
jgi:flagellar biosynthesis protein FlhG